MSTYYMFYVGYQTEDNKFHAYGPYDKFGQLTSFYSKSRSFISDIHEEFIHIDTKDMDDELLNKFTHEYTKGKPQSYLHYLPVNQLPPTDFIKKGYYHIDDVTEYMKDPYEVEIKYCDHYEVDEYSVKLITAVRKDDKADIDALKEFVFFSYPDMESREYDSFMLSNAVSFNGIFQDYSVESKVKDNNEKLKQIVILMAIC